MTGDYIVDDAVGWLESAPEASAQAVFVDDAWARPERRGKWAEYDTHDLDTTFKIVDECMRVLQPGGYLIADADDYLLPRLVNHLREEHGDYAATYSGGGFLKVGGVTIVDRNGDPRRNLAGEYLTNGGYSTVFAVKGEPSVRSSVSVRQIAEKPSSNYGWKTVKPIVPYREWVSATCDAGDHIVIPCAGTAPAAIGAELEFGDRASFTAIDVEPDAKAAFERRRSSVVSNRGKPASIDDY